MPKHGTSSRQTNSARYYLRHREEILASRAKNRKEGKVSSAARNLTKEKQTYVNNLKATTPCADCLRAYPSYVMDFDHVRGEKIANIAFMVGQGYAWEDILTELEKCEVVCSNCHRERTHKQKP